MSKIINTAIFAIVGVLVFSALLIPVVADSNTETKTYTNDGIPYKLADQADELVHTIVVSTVDNETFVITTDGEICTTPNMSLYGSATIVYCANISLRLYPTGAITGDGQNAAGVTSGYNLGTVTDDNPITITITGTDVASGSLQFADARAFISTVGEDVLTVKPYVNKDSSIMIIGGVSVGAVFGAVNITGIGTVDDFTAKIVRGNGTLDGVTVNTTTIETNLVKVDSIVLDLEYGGNSNQLTYTYFLAPSIITYDNPGYIGGSVGDLLNILPLLVAVVLLIGVIGACLYTRIE